MHNLYHRLVHCNLNGCLCACFITLYCGLAHSDGRDLALIGDADHIVHVDDSLWQNPGILAHAVGTDGNPFCVSCLKAVELYGRCLVRYQGDFRAAFFYLELRVRILYSHLATI